MNYVFTTPKYGVLSLLPYPKGLGIKVTSNCVLVAQYDEDDVVVPAVIKKSELGMKIPNSILTQFGYNGNGVKLLKNSITKNTLKNVRTLGSLEDEDEIESVDLSNLTEVLNTLGESDTILVRRG